MAQGRHAWIEVYFPDLGWVPFDPQSSELFVSNRFIRVEVGLDNNETEQDGLVRWFQVKDTSGGPRFDEDINAGFVADRMENLSALKMAPGIKPCLMRPGVVVWPMSSTTVWLDLYQNSKTKRLPSLLIPQ